MSYPVDKGNQKNSIFVSRNAPTAFVVGGAGFIGSHLCDYLLSKDIQVIAIDDFSTGKKENLLSASKNKKFHFINESIITSISSLTSNLLLSVDLPRLDYAFFVADSSENKSLLEKGLANFLAFIKRNSQARLSKVVFVSSIELYDRAKDDYLATLKAAEIFFAKFAKEYKLNARVVRLADVYGPRMHFRKVSSIGRLIQASLLGALGEERTETDFTTRAIFIDDATHLIAKSVLSGGTAQKIYDGALLVPIKIAEVRQVLLDPLWHESRHFIPTELPPWPTPNIEKTMKELSWNPATPLVKALKETIVYFKDNQVEVPLIEERVTEFESPWKHKSLAQVFEKTEKVGDKTQITSKKEEKPTEKKGSRRFLKIRLSIFIGLILIFIGLVWPFLQILFGIFSIQTALKTAALDLKIGEFTKAQAETSKVKSSLETLVGVESSLSIFKKIKPVESYFSKYDELISLTQEGVNGVGYAISGAQALFKATKVISGEEKIGSAPLYDKAQLDLAIADQKINSVILKLKDSEFLAGLPGFLRGRVNDLSLRLDVYSNLANKAKTAALLLPSLTSLDGQKTYLVLLQNNLELRPTGGFIGSYARIVFDHGRLSSIKVDDIYNLDGALKELIEPPLELKQDLGQDRLFLRDSNFDPDFPTSAKVAQLFYKKEAGENIHGVFAVDLSASSKLLSAVGGVDLVDYGEHIDGTNLFAKAIEHAEVGFFPGSQAKRNWLTALSNELFNKVFFLSKQDWPAIIEALGQGLDEKHILLYFSDPNLLSYGASEDWVGLMPRQAKARLGESEDFLAVNEANFGVNKANYYLERSFNLETVISKEYQINHLLKIHYKNNSPSDTFPAGIYKNRFRIYLPNGTKLNKAEFKDIDITSSFSSFSDYSRAGYSALLEIAPKEEVTLLLDYTLNEPLSFNAKKVKYSLNILKQPGTEKDSFDWQLSYPINLQASSGGDQVNLSSQSLKISTDLLKSRIVEVSLTQ